MSFVKSVVFDTSTLISAAIRTTSVPAQAYQLALKSCRLYASEETLDELANVLRRDYLDRYLEREEREKFLLVYISSVTQIPVPIEVTDCRDPKDNKFLSLALAAQAEVLVSSDGDLQALHPYRGMSILKPVDFVALQQLPPGASLTIQEQGGEYKLQ